MKSRKPAKDSSGSARAGRYANDVLTGKIEAPELVRLACERFAKDLDREDIEYRADLADTAVKNIELLRHVKGRWRGQHIVLEDFQCFVVCNVFGWVWADSGKRRFRYAYIQMPRKNGKTLLAISIALMMLAADGEPGAEVYLGATGQEQARNLLFHPAKQICEICPEFKDAFGIEVNASSLVIPESFSRLMSVIKKPDDGYNPSCAVVDEYHEHESDDQWSTFDTGMGSREQPLLLTITTAGSNLSGPCKELRDDSVKVLEGSSQSESRFVLIYEPDAEDAWDDMQTVRKCNPAIGVSVSEAYLADQLHEARKSASKQNAFRTKHLNQWVGAKVAWMNMLAWQRQQRKGLDPESFRAQKAYLAVDLASKKDIAAIAAIVPGGNQFNAFAWFFAPDAAADDNDMYRRYETAGCLTLTDGSATDYATIQAKIEELAALFDVQGIAFDPWQAQYLMQQLQDKGLPVEEFPHQVRTFSDPMKELESLVLDGRFHHDGNKALTDMMANVAAKMDVKENIYPNKARPNDPKCKIDGVVALIMAMGLTMRAREVSTIDEWLANPVSL